MNFSSFVTEEIRNEYRAGTGLNVQFNCANDQKLYAHEEVLGLYSLFFRQSIETAKRDVKSDAAIELDCTIYQQETIELFLSLLYQMNVENVTIVESVQLIDFLHEGTDCSEWHRLMIRQHCKNIIYQINSLSIPQRVDLAIALYHNQSDMVKSLVKHCITGISEEQFSDAILTLIKHDETDTNFHSCMIAIFLRQRGIHINPENVKRQVVDVSDVIVKSYLKQKGPSDRKQCAKLCVDILMHASSCRKARCDHDTCQKMKGVIAHFKNCQSKSKTSCRLCKQFISLCMFHGKDCNNDKCSIPYCNRIKQSMKRCSSRRT